MLLLTLLQAAESSNRLVKAAEPWANLYSDSKTISAIVLSLHLLPLLTGGGAAFMADRATLRAARGAAADRTRQLGELARIHRLVVFGLGISLVSGVLMFLSDVETFLPSPFFWTKLALVALLLINGFAMTRTERSLARGGDADALWSRMRTSAIASMALWIATTIAGVVLSQFA